MRRVKAQDKNRKLIEAKKKMKTTNGMLTFFMHHLFAFEDAERAAH